MNSAGRSCVLCATLVQVGRDTLTLKEPVTRWHGVAWLHPYCRDTIVVLVPRSADSAASFVAPGIAGSSALPRQLLQPFCCVHMLTLINESENRYIIFVLPSLPFCILYSSSPYFVIEGFSLAREHSLFAQREIGQHNNDALLQKMNLFFCNYNWFSVDNL